MLQRDKYILPTATRLRHIVTSHLQYINGTATRREKRPARAERRFFSTLQQLSCETEGQAGVSELRETLVASSTPPIDARDRQASSSSPARRRLAARRTGAPRVPRTRQ